MEVAAEQELIEAEVVAEPPEVQDREAIEENENLCSM